MSSDDSKKKIENTNGKKAFDTTHKVVGQRIANPPKPNCTPIPQGTNRNNFGDTGDNANNLTANNGTLSNIKLDFGGSEKAFDTTHKAVGQRIANPPKPNCTPTPQGANRNYFGNTGNNANNLTANNGTLSNIKLDFGGSKKAFDTTHKAVGQRIANPPKPNCTPTPQGTNRNDFGNTGNNANNLTANNGTLRNIKLDFGGSKKAFDTTHKAVGQRIADPPNPNCTPTPQGTNRNNFGDTCNNANNLTANNGTLSNIKLDFDGSN